MATIHDSADAPESDREAPPPTCANCATVLTGDHCHGCGQPAHLHRSVAAIGHDLWHGILHLDGKLANTLPLLAIRPGRLTRRYIAGERRRFVSPMGMFLFSVTVLFLAMQVLGVHLSEIGEDALVGPDLARVEASLTQVASAPPDTQDETDKPVAAERARAALPLVRQAQEVWGGPVFNPKEDGTGNALLDAAVDKVTKDPALVAYKVQANSYKFSWALIPLSVPFVWLLFFWRRDLGLYDHTVFVTYSLASITLLSVVGLVLVRVGVSTGAVWLAFFLLAPAHIWTHLRGSYGLSKRSTLWRFVLLSLFIWPAVGLFAVILFALGALG